MGVSGVLFDLDGTLADTASAEREAWAAIADVVERHLPAVDRAELHGRYASVFEPHWTSFLGGEIDFGEYRRRRLAEAVRPWGDLTEELFEAYRLEKRGSIERLRPFDDAVETLRALRATGVRVGLLTNGPSDLQRRKLAVTDLARELDAIAISEEIGASKPDPRAFDVAAGLLGVERQRLAMVGDSPAYDIEGALGAGLAAAVLVTGGLDVEAAGAIVVDRLSDVPTVLELDR